MNTKHKLDNHKQAVIDCYLSGKTITKTADEFGVVYATVASFLKLHGIKRATLDANAENQTTICSKCAEVRRFPGDFYMDGSKKSGHSPRCKFCEKSYNQTRKKRLPVLHDDRTTYKSPNRRVSSAKYAKSDKGRMSSLRARSKRRARAGQHSLTTEEWSKTLAAFHNACAYCGATSNLTVEHFIPVAKGGQTVLGNIIPACRTCNCSKRDTMPQEWCQCDTLQSILTTLQKL